MTPSEYDAAQAWMGQAPQPVPTLPEYSQLSGAIGALRPRRKFVVGSAYTHQQQNWMADSVDASTPGLPGAAQHSVPWTVPMADAANGVMIQPKHGAVPTRAEAWNVMGNSTGYAECLPFFDALGLSYQRTSEISDQFTLIAAALRANPFPSGPRGTAVTHSLGIWIPHPTISPSVNPRAKTVWIFIDHAGRVYEQDRDCYLHDRGVIPGFETSDAVVDFAFNPLNRHEATLVAASGKVLRILRDVTHGGASSAGPEDASKWGVTQLCVMGRPRGIRYRWDGACFVADDNPGTISQLAPTGVLTPFATIPGAWAIRFKSDSTMVVFTTNTAVYLISPSGTVSADLFPAASKYYSVPPAEGSVFWVMDVDVYGAIGPVDDIYLGRSHGAGNNDLWRMHGDGTGFTSWAFFWGTKANGFNVVGPFAGCREVSHYTWVIAIHVDQARMLVGGFGNMSLTELVFDPPTPASGPCLDYSIIGRGIQVLKMGASTNTQTLPSFTCQTSHSGNGLRWFDEIAPLGFDGVAAYWRAGGIGNYDRSAVITQQDIACLTAHTCLNSQEALKGGAAYTNALASWLATQGLTGNLFSQGSYAPNNGLITGDRQAVASPGLRYLDVKLVNGVPTMVACDWFGTADSGRPIPSTAYIDVDNGGKDGPGEHVYRAIVPGQVPPLSTRAVVLVR